MNYTKNYRLPQWVKEDRIMMDDFNAMNSSIESGLSKTAAEASAARADASEAKQTADSAHSIAQQITNAAYTPPNKPYKVGSYVGNGSSMTVNLGFRPSFVVISGMEGSPSTSHYDTYDHYFAMTAGNVLQGRVDFTSSGFVAHAYNSTIYPNMSEQGRRYDYIAFK